MARDDLDRYVKVRSKREPDLPERIRAAEARQAIARQLAARREEAKLSQTQVAAKMSTSASVVSRVERGGDVQLSTLQKYAAALDLSLRLTFSEEKAEARRPRPARARARARGDKRKGSRGKSGPKTKSRV